MREREGETWWWVGGGGRPQRPWASYEFNVERWQARGRPPGGVARTTRIAILLPILPNCLCTGGHKVEQSVLKWRGASLVSLPR